MDPDPKMDVIGEDIADDEGDESIPYGKITRGDMLGENKEEEEMENEPNV